jgi:hypothetical protein
MAIASCISEAQSKRESAAAACNSFSHYYAVAWRTPLGTPADIAKITEVVHHYTGDYSYDPEIRWVSRNEVLVATTKILFRLRRHSKSWRVIQAHEYVTVG